jgi:hypothetical protein
LFQALRQSVDAAVCPDEVVVLSAGFRRVVQFPSGFNFGELQAKLSWRPFQRESYKMVDRAHALCGGLFSCQCPSQWTFEQLPTLYQC